MRKLALHKQNLKASQSLLNSNIRTVLQFKRQMKTCFYLKKKKTNKKNSSEKLHRNFLTFTSPEFFSDFF